ncbi:MAG: hypothetical protein ACKOHI_10535, partial [Phycisphaerales bacterium]
MSARALRIALVLAAVAVAAWLAVRARPAASEGRVVRQPLFAVDEIPVEQVDRLELERPGAPTLAFVRSAEGWSQSTPFAHPADAAAIRMVIDAFASLESTRAVDPASLDPEARVSLGLDPARARVTVAWPGGSRTVVLGRRTVAGRAWARVDGRGDAASVDAGLHAIALEDHRARPARPRDRHARTRRVEPERHARLGVERGRVHRARRFERCECVDHHADRRRVGRMRKRRR